MWETIAPLAVVPALLGLFGAVLRRSLARSSETVARWARDEGLDLRRYEWRFSGGELLLVLHVVDRGGRTKDGWARCGNPLIGMLSRRVEVRWMKEGESAFR